MIFYSIKINSAQNFVTPKVMYIDDHVKIEVGFRFNLWIPEFIRVRIWRSRHKFGKKS